MLDKTLPVAGLQQESAVHRQVEEHSPVTVPQARQKTTSSREAHREERRRVVLEAAERLISRDGLAQFSMRVLAKETGIPAPTLYGYFESKQAVLGALADQKIGILRSYVLREAKGAEPGMQRLMAFARGYRRFALEGVDYYDMFISRSSILSVDEARDVANRPGYALMQTLAVDVEAAIARGEMRPVDPQRAIIGLWATAHGFLSLELRNVLPEWEIGDDEREDAYLQYFEAMLKGFQAATPETETFPEAGSWPGHG